MTLSLTPRDPVGAAARRERSRAATIGLRGAQPRLYVPYGRDWFRYWMRRVAESQGAAESIIYLCALIADQPRAIDRHIDYFVDGTTRQRHPDPPCAPDGSYVGRAATAARLGRSAASRPSVLTPRQAISKRLAQLFAATQKES